MFFASNGQESRMSIPQGLNDVDNIINNNQSFYMKFKPSTSCEFFIALDGDIEIKIESFHGRKLKINIPDMYEQEIDSDFVIDSEHWYNIIIGISGNGQLLGALWLDNEEESTVYFDFNLGSVFRDIHFDVQSWHVNIIFKGESTFIIDNFAYYTFDYKMTDHIIDDEQDTLDKEDRTLRLDFDNDADLDYFQENFSEKNAETYIENGMLVFSGTNYARKSLNLNDKYPKGSIIHVRAKTFLSEAGGNNALAIGLMPTNMVFTANCRGPYEYEYYSESGDATAYAYFRGERDIINTGQWVDIIIYLDENGLEHRAILCETDNIEKIQCSGILMPQDLYLDNLYLSIEVSYWNIYVPSVLLIINSLFIGTDKSQYHEPNETYIDFVYITQGSLQEYLEEHLPAYLENKEYVDAFLSQPPYRFEDLVLYGLSLE